MAQDHAIAKLLLEFQHYVAHDVIDDYHLAGLRAARDEMIGLLAMPQWKRELYDATVEAICFRRGGRPNTCDTIARMERYDLLVEKVCQCIQRTRLDDDVIALIDCLRNDMVFETKLDYRTSPAGGALAAS